MYIACGRHHNDIKSIVILMMAFIEGLLCANDYAQRLSCFISLNSHSRHNTELTFYPYFIDEKNLSLKKPASLR